MAIVEEPRLDDRQRALRREARAWLNATVQKFAFRLAAMGLRQQGELIESLGGRIRTRDGDVESLAFSFARHGIFLEHGVGRGRPVGSPQARQAAKPWLKPVLDAEMQGLADLLANEYADLAAESVRILIPGVIDTKINVG